MTEVEQRTDAESIARWITEFDANPPLETSAEEELRWQENRRIRGDF